MLTSLKKRSRKSPFTSLADSSALSLVDTWISTQCLPLDDIMGGGAPVGRMVEIYGDEASGKTLICLHLLAEVQQMGGIAVMIDTETAIALTLAEIVGVDLDELIYCTPSTIEEVWDNISEVMKIKEDDFPDVPMLIVWDSVAATSSEAEVKKVMEKGLNTGYPPTAREISQMMRVMSVMIARNNTAFVMTNQAKVKIGVLFGDKVATFGGKSIGFHSSIRLHLKKVSVIRDKARNPLGVTVRVKAAKNKVHPPFGECTFPVLFDVGIDDAGAVFTWLKNEKIIRASGGWCYLEVDEEELRFRSDGFGEIYEDYRDAILEMMYGTDEEYEEEE